MVASGWLGFDLIEKKKLFTKGEKAKLDPLVFLLDFFYFINDLVHLFVVQVNFFHYYSFLPFFYFILYYYYYFFDPPFRSTKQRLAGETIYEGRNLRGESLAHYIKY